ncbi:MAG: CCA tRNA nucleotidyltransferase [Bradymonadia bacterium]
MLREFSAKVPDAAYRVISTLRQAGYEAFLVGGCVRDGILKRQTNDWDITTNARPNIVCSLFERVIETGIQHGTVTVCMASEQYEVTTYRIDQEYCDGRRPASVVFTDSLREDLARRDFTINAMAYDPMSDILFDPFEGVRDLNAGLIRAVGEAHLRLDEDGLRAFRAVRFACVLDFTLEPELVLAIKQTVEKALLVSAERIHTEIKKTLMSGRAASGLTLLAQGGLLAGPLGALSQASRAELDVVTSVIDAMPTEWPMRLACLASLAGDDAASLFSALKVSNKDKAMASRYLDSLTRSLPANDADLVAYLATLGREHWRSVLTFLSVMRPSEVEKIAHLRQRVVDARLETLPFTTKELAVDGRVLMSQLELEPSKRIGIILNRLLMMVWSGTISNESPDLLRAAKGLVASSGATA